jgi:hydrogenase maturation protease
MMMEDNRLLVLGIGNVLLGDEGVGVQVVKELEKHRLPDHVTLLDGGTGGFHLLEYLQDYPRIIMIDATLDGKPGGTISVIHPKFSHEFPRTLSAHDIGLKDLVESAALLGKLPEITLYTVSVNPEQSLSMELSEGIRKAADTLARMILEALRNEKSS